MFVCYSGFSIASLKPLETSGGLSPPFVAFGAYFYSKRCGLNKMVMFGNQNMKNRRSIAAMLTESGEGCFTEN